MTRCELLAADPVPVALQRAVGELRESHGSGALDTIFHALWEWIFVAKAGCISGPCSGPGPTLQASFSL